MNRWLRRAALPMLALMCSVALAQAPKAADAPKCAPAAGSQEAQVAARFTERSGMKPDQVFRGRPGCSKCWCAASCITSTPPSIS